MVPPDKTAAAIADRLVPVGLALIAAYALSIGAMWATGHGGVDAMGRPLGTDFSNVWAAGRLVLAGEPQAAYDLARHYSVQQAEFGAGVPFYGWHYPPMFLAVAALLATLPYLAALVVWQATTLPIYLFAIVKILGSRRREALIAALAFPAVFVNLTHGHNGFLTAGLFGLGLAILDRRPLLAGVLFGLLAYKPQFGVLLPFVLIATGRWRTAASAAGTVLVIALASYAAFGHDAWAAFEASSTFTRTVVLEQGSTGWEKIMSVFAAVRALGGSVPAAYAAQAAAAAAVVLTTIWIWRRDAPFAAKAAALLAGSVLMTPYCLDYDLMLLAPAIAFMAREAIETGWRRWEAATLTVVFVTPLVARTVAEATLAPIGLFSVVALFVLAARRAGLFAPLTRMPSHATDH